MGERLDFAAKGRSVPSGTSLEAMGGRLEKQKEKGQPGAPEAVLQNPPG
jgi:hypothetical protein